ncbi:DUF4886 domain-containing protein [Pedobacter aquatilis]|uniref:DUF4886 domain-containing protein n=1 Tax=Pedobacter aquatilis TaxID=351343 RepID=UPI00292EF273|nr:DUF4886 domain-containing protein [Pedobacter aquatilis]
MQMFKSKLRFIPQEKISLYLTVFMVLLAFIANGQTVKPLRLFFIGNSFSQNASRFLPQISESGGHKLIIGRAEIGGCPLQKHWEAVEANDADSKDPKGMPYNGKSLRALLSDGVWDVVSIQQYSLLSGDSATYEPYAAKLYQFIKQLQPDAKVVFHQTWAYRIDAKEFGKIHGEKRAESQEQMWEYSRSAYHKVAGDLGIKIVPTGDAFQKINSNIKLGFKKDLKFNYENPGFPLLPDQLHSLNVGYSYSKEHKLNFDPNHANDAGCYLAGLVWYTFLFKDEPAKVSFKPETVDEAFAKELKKAAKAVVK